MYVRVPPVGRQAWLGTAPSGPGGGGLKKPLSWIFDGGLPGGPAGGPFGASGVAVAEGEDVVVDVVDGAMSSVPGTGKRLVEVEGTLVSTGEAPCRFMNTCSGPSEVNFPLRSRSRSGLALKGSGTIMAD